MILSIHQPSYFPWLGLLDKIAKSDVYMVMDEVQLTDAAYQHRNIFLTADGKIKYLTIPFKKT
ncbi:MAG TPA: WbqC family protein, partial [Syntrophorhabdaceae bacterium]